MNGGARKSKAPPESPSINDRLHDVDDAAAAAGANAYRFPRRGRRRPCGAADDAATAAAQQPRALLGIGVSHTTRRSLVASDLFEWKVRETAASLFFSFVDVIGS